ncbi:hypothetical protein MPSEU_000700500 [Mayamaea pseudoterrestris]|nr:hypothetical protein MPSEU_000700500 [Mayamaea pseudoterrestris]
MSLIYQAGAASGQTTRSGLYIGGKDDAKNTDKLKRWKVSHILNVTPVKQANIQAGVPNYFDKSYIYKRIPVLDNPTSATDFLSHAESIVDFIATGLCHGSVLVHCQHGVSRSTTAILFYLMRRVGMSLQDGLTMIQRRRPQAQPIPAFLTILQQYYETKCQLNEQKPSSDPSKRKAMVGPAMPPDKRARKPIGPTLPASLSVSIEESSRVEDGGEGKQADDQLPNVPPSNTVTNVARTRDL